MSRGTTQLILALVAVLALGAAAWNLFARRSQVGTSDGDIQQTALCASCGYYAETTQSALQELAPSDGTRPAVCPQDGPGYKCPKCGKQTLYQNPIVCPQCGTKFLLSRDENGAPVVRCPKCGWEP